MSSEAVVLKAEKRDKTRRRANAALRQQGRMPGIIYGKGEENLNIHFDFKNFQDALHSGKRMLDIELEGSQKKVLLKDVQYGTYDHQLLHADFTVVSETTMVKVMVSIELKSEAAGVKLGGVVEQELRELHIECMAAKIPDSIELDLQDLQIGQTLHISDLPQLDGVKYLDAVELPVVLCHLPIDTAEDEATEELEVESGGAEPEVIGKKDANEEEE